MLQIGDIFLSEAERLRIQLQNKHELLYNSEFSQTTTTNINGLNKVTTTQQIQILPIPATISDTWRNLLFLEFPAIDFEDDKVNEFFKPVLDRLQIDTLEASPFVSSVGMLFWSLFKENGVVDYEFNKPQTAMWQVSGLDKTSNIMFFKEVESNKTQKTFQITEHILGGVQTTDSSGTTSSDRYILIEYLAIVNMATWMVEKIIPLSDKVNEIDFIPVVPIWNSKNLNSMIGKSDYRGVEQLFAEADNLIHQIQSVLYENSEPWTLIPPGILNAQGQFNRRNGKLIEKANGGATDNDISMVEWSGQLGSAFEQFNLLIRQILFNSHISPQLAGWETKGGSDASGRALKWSSIPTWSARNIKRKYWDRALRKFFNYYSRLDGTIKEVEPDSISIVWQDGLPMDIDAVTENLVKQIQNGLIDQVTALKELHDLDEAAALDMQQSIRDELTNKANANAANFPIVL